MESKKPLIFNVQRFSTHDGPGIRTTIFFKGCPLNCLWCHNPESQSFEKETMIDENGNKTIVGDYYTVEKLVDIVKKDQLYYDNSGGGVTLSGGEVMAMDMDYIKDLIMNFHKWGIEVAIDTSGFTDRKNIEKIDPYVDLWLYDLKLLDDKDHQEYIGVSNKIILENLKYLSEINAKINLRLLVTGGLNDSVAYAEEVKEYLKSEKISINQIDILPYHNFGRNKYKQLYRKCTQNFEEPSDDILKGMKEYLESNNFRVSIGG